jgi:hypothetical protein
MVINLSEFHSWNPECCGKIFPKHENRASRATREDRR